MKNIMIVAKQGNALALGDMEGTIAKSATGSFLPNLLVLKEVLSAIPTEIGETVNIHLMDTVQGLVSGSALEYIKTKKTASGKDMSQEEVDMFKEIYTLYAERIFNVRFSQVRFLKKDDVALQEMKKKAYDALDSHMASNGLGTATTVDPDKELREMFDTQIKEAMAAKDMDLMKSLMEMRKELKEPQVVSTGRSSYAPTFEANKDVDKEVEEIVNDENQEAVQFANVGEEPTW